MSFLSLRPLPYDPTICLRCHATLEDAAGDCSSCGWVHGPQVHRRFWTLDPDAQGEQRTLRLFGAPALALTVYASHHAWCSGVHDPRALSPLAALVPALLFSDLAGLRTRRASWTGLESWLPLLSFAYLCALFIQVRTLTRGHRLPWPDPAILEATSHAAVLLPTVVGLCLLQARLGRRRRSARSLQIRAGVARRRS